MSGPCSGRRRAVGVGAALEGHELEGLTSAQLEAAARRHNVSVGIDGGRGQLLRAIAGSPAAVLARKEARAYLSGVNRAPPQRRGN